MRYQQDEYYETRYGNEQLNMYGHYFIAVNETKSYDNEIGIYDLWEWWS